MSLFAACTPTERQIIDYLIEGQSNKEIARALGRSDAAVKMHIRNILIRTRLNNRTKVAIAALREREGW